MRKLLPSWFTGYQRSWLAGDLTAGMVVTVMLIPQSLAYAMLAGLPPEVGLYASVLPLFAYALFGSSMALAVQRRLLWFPLREQALQIVPLFLVAALLEWATRLIVHDAWPHWSQLLAPFMQAALWPLVGAVLLAPQRRAFDPDNIRPL